MPLQATLVPRAAETLSSQEIMMECLICSGKIESPMVHEDEIVIAFLDYAFNEKIRAN